MSFAPILLDHPRGRIDRWLPTGTALTLVVAACVSAVTILPAVRLTHDPAAQQRWIADHFFSWVSGWVVIELAMLLLAAFYVWWMARVELHRMARVLKSLLLVGLAFDTFGIVWLVFRVPLDGEPAFRLATLASGGIATGVYCLIGMLLTFHTVGLSRSAMLLQTFCWTAGFGLVLGSICNSPLGSAVSAAAMWSTFPCLIIHLGAHFRSMNASNGATR